MEYPVDLLKGSVVPIVLSLLAEGAMYGYEMVKQVDARSGGKLQWREGTLYPTLHKLEEEGLLKAEWREASGSRSRKYYTLTTQGRRELKRRAAEFRDFASTVHTLLGGA